MSLECFAYQGERRTQDRAGSASAPRATAGPKEGQEEAAGTCEERRLCRGGLRKGTVTLGEGRSPRGPHREKPVGSYPGKLLSPVRAPLARPRQHIRAGQPLTWSLGGLRQTASWRRLEKRQEQWTTCKPEAALSQLGRQAVTVGNLNICLSLYCFP